MQPIMVLGLRRGSHLPHLRTSFGHMSLVTSYMSQVLSTFYIDDNMLQLRVSNYGSQVVDPRSKVTDCRLHITFYIDKRS